MFSSIMATHDKLQKENPLPKQSASGETKRERTASKNIPIDISDGNSEDSSPTPSPTSSLAPSSKRAKFVQPKEKEVAANKSTSKPLSLKQPSQSEQPSSKQLSQEQLSQLSGKRLPIHLGFLDMPVTRFKKGTKVIYLKSI